MKNVLHILTITKFAEIKMILINTNEYVYNRYKDGCNHAIGCFINANGTTGDGLGRYSKNVFITNEIFKNSEIDRHGRYWA